MDDLTGMPGPSSGFQPDARFAEVPDEGTSLPHALAAMHGRMGGGVHQRQRAGREGGFSAEHDWGAKTIPPPPDPIAQARAEAYAQGAADARAALAEETAHADALRAKLAHNFARLDAELCEQFRQRLMDTVVALCEATLSPLALDREALAHRVERAAAMFARADDERVIRLHPDDLKLVRSQLPKDWAFTPDPGLTRGAIRVESRNGGVESGGVEDGPEQWRRAIAEALDLGGLD